MLTPGITACPPFALGSTGVNSSCVEEPSVRRVGRGFGPRQPPPQADRPPHGEELRIYEMSETTNPASLARSRLLHDLFPPEYAATRARRAISFKHVRHSNDDLWSFVMLPDAPAVSMIPLPLFPRDAPM
jgi:hypothetical protein